MVTFRGTPQVRLVDLLASPARGRFKRLPVCVAQNPTFRVEELEELVTTFPVRPDDVFICTYPKCGTTWMQQICHLLVNGGDQV